jgi:hypothetical protein
MLSTEQRLRPGDRVTRRGSAIVGTVLRASCRAAVVRWSRTLTGGSRLGGRRTITTTVRIEFLRLLDAGTATDFAPTRARTARRRPTGAARTIADLAPPDLVMCVRDAAAECGLREDELRRLSLARYGCGLEELGRSAARALLDVLGQMRFAE